MELQIGFSDEFEPVITATCGRGHTLEYRPHELLAEEAIFCPCCGESEPVRWEFLLDAVETARVQKVDHDGHPRVSKYPPATIPPIATDHARVGSS